MFTFATHYSLLPRNRASLLAVVFAQSDMNHVSRISALPPPGLPASRIP